MPNPDAPPLTRAVVLRGAGFAVAIALGAVAVWLIVIADSTKSMRLGVLAGIWGALLGAYSMFGARRHGLEPEPSSVSDVPVLTAHEIAVRSHGDLERVAEAAARRAFEDRLEQMLRRELSREVADVRSEIARLRQDLLDKVGGQLRLERIETTRVIGSDLEALQHEVRQLKQASETGTLHELGLGVAPLRKVVEPARVRPISRPAAEAEADVKPARSIDEPAPAPAPARSSAPDVQDPRPVAADPAPVVAAPPAAPAPVAPVTPAAAATPTVPAAHVPAASVPWSPPLSEAVPAAAAASRGAPPVRPVGTGASSNGASSNGVSSNGAGNRASGNGASGNGASSNGVSSNGASTGSSSNGASSNGAAGRSGRRPDAPTPAPAETTGPIRPAAPARPQTPAAAAASRPAVGTPAPAPSTESRPTESRPTESRPTESRPTESRPTVSRPGDRWTPPSAPAQPARQQPAGRPAAAQKSEPPPAATAPAAPAAPPDARASAAPSSSDPFASLPRITPFTEFELDPVDTSTRADAGPGHDVSTGPASPVAPASPAYTGRRRRTGVGGEPDAGRHSRSEPAPVADEVRGRRRRPDEDEPDDENLLSRLLARGSADR